MCGHYREDSTHIGECDTIRKIFTRNNKLRSLEERFIYPTSAAARRRQAKRILFACPGEGAPTSIINFMIILWKNILISFYKVDIENSPFNPDAVWHYTLKRFAGLALAQAHEARTLRLRAISRREDPPSLSQFQARIAPLATLGEEAKLIFSDPLYDYLIEFNLERYTINRPKM
jgi:hypothetical protein